jgi:drug/metabolite transporter (DMT)-like permease
MTSLRLAYQQARRQNGLAQKGAAGLSEIVGWKVLACLSFAGINGLTKTLCLSPFQLVFIQNLTAGLVLTALAGIDRSHLRLLSQPTFWARALFAFAGTCLWVYALQRGSLLTCVATGLLGPFITSFGAWLIFGEQLTRARLAAIALATVGGMLVLHGDLPRALYDTLTGQPGASWGALDKWALAPMASTLCFVASNLCAKQLLAKQNALVLTGWQMLACAGLSALTATPWIQSHASGWLAKACPQLMLWKSLPFLLQTPVIVKLIALSGLTAIAHLSLNSAIKMADLTLLLPIGALRLLANLGLAWYLFKETPQLSSVCGIAVIMLALTLLFHKEARER